jgi:hypothetical protein
MQNGSSKFTTAQQNEFIDIDGFSIRPGTHRVGQYAADLGLHVATLKRAIRSGKLTATRVGDLLFTSDRAIAAWLTANRVNAKAA